MSQLTHTEFKECTSGTKAKKVKCFDGEGNQYPSIYVLLDDPRFEDELEDAQIVAPGYYTEIWNVTRN